jgi:hypothetical protein
LDYYKGVKKMDFPTIAEVFPTLSTEPWFQFVVAILGVILMVALGGGLDFAGTEVSKVLTRLLGKGFQKLPVLKKWIKGEPGIRGDGSKAVSVLLAYVLAFVVGFPILEGIPQLQNIAGDPELSETILNIMNALIVYSGGKYIHDEIVVE